MSLENYYWYFKKALPKRTCEDIIKTYKDKSHHKGTIGQNKKVVTDLKTRNTNIVFTNDPWLYREIQPFTNIANKNANWNFDIDSSESCQVATYKKNQFYNWHRDTHDKSSDKIRKLSVTVNLSNPKNYNGGELEFDFKDNPPDITNQTHICTEILPVGSIVVFPSHVWHRVKPITNGERKSLVIWNLGKPFK